MLVENMFLEKQQPGAKSQTPLFGIPGLRQWANVGSGPIRGMHIMNGVLYVVSGTVLWSVDQDTGAVTELGDDIGESGLVSMADNGTQLCIVNGVSGWIYSVATGFDQITDPDFYPSSVVIFVDGYFAFARVGTIQWFLSDLYDGLSYSATDFASAESTSTPIVAIAQNLQMVFIFKQDDTELWYNAGTADFPFARQQGGVIPFGCAATFSVVKQDGAIFFLGSDGIYYRMQGNAPIRVSTHSIETMIQAEPDPSLITCATWTWEGHKWIILNLPSQNKTVVYDISTSLWATRKSYTDGDVSLGRWRVTTALDNGEGRVYLGDYVSGRIWLEDWDLFTEGDWPIIAMVRSAPLHADRHRVFISRFELDIQAGVGNGAAPDPQAMLRWSKDGGQTWSLLQPWRSMGQVGQYTKRLRWLALGQARQWNFELVISDPVRRVIIGAHADVEVGLD